MNHMGISFDAAFAFSGDRNILLPKDLGIVNHHIAVSTPNSSVAAFGGLFAPPFASSNFAFDIRVNGERVSAGEFTWLPNAIYRAGRAGDLCVETLTALPEGLRAALMRVKITGAGKRARVQACVSGGLDYVHQWEFPVPQATKSADLYADARMIGRINNDKAWLVATSGALQYFAPAGFWEGEVPLSADGAAQIDFAFSIGERLEAREDAEKVIASPDFAIQSAEAFMKSEEARLNARLPRFTCDDPRLERFYARSLVHYITNRWEIDEFVLNPYLSTNGVNGGCMCSYLWDYSGGWKTHAMYDAALDKAQIRQFLKIDLGRAFAFTPVDGAAYGPWYPVNQEKIIALIYYYVAVTGDAAFLTETVNGRTVLEHAVRQATLKDDPACPGALYDYGVDGEHHLELRRGIPYHGVLPDLNARRYMGYMRAYELTRLCGAPNAELLARAEALKRAVRETLWDADAGWFRFIMKTGESARYTIQMFKLLDSPVLDEDMREGLLSHLNEREFLSEFGVHSMSKLDPAYDQIDIDNGGGGACTLFPILIAEKLYAIGKPELANDILRRILWWGERAPYWGDSFVANQLEYRQDTPLMATIGGVTGAQTIIFGAFGIDIALDGTITVNPPAKRPAANMRLENVRLRGKCFGVALENDCFTVSTGDRRVTSAYGNAVALTI